MVFSDNDNDIMVGALKFYRAELYRRIEVDRDQIFDYADTKILMDRIDKLIGFFSEEGPIEHE